MTEKNEKMKLYICAAFDKEKSLAVLPCAIDVMQRYGAAPLMKDGDRKYYSDSRVIYDSHESIMSECDVILTIGGDGTILKWSKAAAGKGKPLIGINTGRLGFMTALDGDETEKLSELIKGNYTVTERMMLSVRVKGQGGRELTALNDVVLMKDMDSKLPEYIVRINGAVVTTIRADGLIFSTPTGSTAYALAAGGPVIAPDVECIQMTPMCAHTLLSRPMIFSGKDTVTVSCRMYEGSRASFRVDGGSGMALSDGEELMIERSSSVLKLISIDKNGFYSAVSNKLMMPLK